MTRFTPSAADGRLIRRGFLVLLWSYRAGLAGIGLLLLLVLSDQRPPVTREGKVGSASSRLSDLVQALGAQRLVEPRLTGGFSYAPCKNVKGDYALHEVRCSPQPRLGSDSFIILANARSELLSTLSEEIPTHRLHTRAILNLLFEDSSLSLNKAVDLLKEAHGLEAKDGEIASDLAAAYVLRAGRNNDPRDLLAAVAWSEEAIRLDPQIEEARFNLALALEKLHLDAQARAAWVDYLSNDRESPWASEARARKVLNTLSIRTRWQKILPTLTTEPLVLPSQALFVDFAQQVRLHLENELLPAWADAVALGDKPRVSKYLRLTEVIARTQEAETGDTLLTDSVRQIMDSEKPSFSLAKRQNLVEGLRLYRDGRRLYEQQNHDAAKPILEHARIELELAGSPFALWAEFYIAVCDYHASRYAVALQSLAGLLGRMGNSNYLSLRGHVEWMIGLTQLDQAQYAESVLAFQRGLTYFKAAREKENIAAMCNLLSRGFEMLGDDLEAWRYRYAALARLSEIDKDRRINNILSSAVDGAVEEGLLSVARRFQSEMVRQTRISGNPLLLTIALHKDASLAARLGRHQEAEAAISEAKIWSTRILGSGVRDRVTADLFMAEGEVLRGENSTGSLKALEQSLALFHEQGARIRLVAAERQRARTLETMGDTANASVAYRAAIAEAEAQLGSVPQEELLAFSAETRNLYNDFIAFAAKHETADQMFFWVEKARESYLQTALAALKPIAARGITARSTLSTLTLASFQAALPKGTVLVEFKLLPDRLLRWTLTTEGMRFRQTPVDPVVLVQAVTGLRESIQKGASLAALRKPLTSLGELVLGEMKGELSTGRFLVVVPDGPLTDLPFDLLFPPGEGQPLIQLLPILSAPSAQSFLASTARLKEMGKGAPETALVFGNPSFERRLFPSLSDLPRAGVEAERIGIAYRQAIVFTANEATRAALERQGPLSEVIHFAGHAVLNKHEIWRSSLLLAKDTKVNDSGVFTVADLARLQLPRTRLVVLAACDTAGGGMGVSDGVPTLLVPLLATGVPYLVASMWEVDDATSSLFFEEFHRRVASGESPTTALREAKLLLLLGPEESLRKPAIWAAFTLVGGVNS